MFVTVLSGALLLIGSLVCISGGVGLMRFPDFYTRMHAVGVTDTLGTAAILIALMLISNDLLVFAKLVMVLLLNLMVGPTTSHVLAKAAYRNGLLPTVSQTVNSKRDKQRNSQPNKNKETTS